MLNTIPIKEITFTNKIQKSKAKNKLRQRLGLLKDNTSKKCSSKNSFLFRSQDFKKMPEKLSLNQKNDYINCMTQRENSNQFGIHKSNTSKNICPISRNIKNNNYTDSNNQTIQTNKINFSSQHNLNIKNNTINFPKHPLYTISVINTEELTKKSNFLSKMFISPIKKPIKSKKYNWNLKKEKYKSLSYHLYKNSKVDEKKIINRYEPKIKDFINEKYHYKLGRKTNDFSNCKYELKFSFGNTRLIMTICDYLNKSLSKYRYHCSVTAEKTKKEEIEKKNKENEILLKKLKNDRCLPVNEFIKIRKIFNINPNALKNNKTNKNKPIITQYNCV